GDAEELEDAEVFLGLRLPAFGGGDDEEARVDAADAGEHVGDEARVPGHVDERDLVARRQRGRREPEVDGEAARLLLGEAVGIDAGEGAHERRLAVVDVARGGDYAQRKASRM